MAFPLPANLLETCDGVIYCLALWASEVTYGVFWAAILMGFGAVLMIGTIRYGTTRAFGFASFSCALAAVFLATMQLMPWWVSSLFILVGALGMVGLVLNER